MSNFLFVMANYQDARQDLFNNYISPRNREYTKLHNFEYLEYTLI